MEHCPAASGQCWDTWHQDALGGSRCVWWEELVGLVCWFHLCWDFEQKPHLCAFLGPLYLSFSLGRAEKGADLGRELTWTGSLSPAVYEMGSLESSPEVYLLAMFLTASLPWLSWEKKALPDLDFSWAPEVLPLIGRLIFNLSHLCLQGKKLSQRVVVPGSL